MEMSENPCGFKKKCCGIPDERDLVEVVRCKDCKKHDTYDCNITYLTTQKTPNDWFCKDGERLEKFDDLKGSENGMKIKEIASKYGVSYNVAYLATYGVDPVTDAMKGREYNEQEIVANMRALILDRIDKHEKKIAELREMLGGIERAE